MADRPRRHAVGSWLTLAAFVAVAAAAPIAVLGGGPSTPDGAVVQQQLAPPPETCRPGETYVTGGFDLCGEGTGEPGGGGLGGFGDVLPLLLAAVAGGAIAIVAAFFVLRRTAAPAVAADPGEWWTCRKCGKTNVLGSARCYACGTWQG